MKALDFSRMTRRQVEALSPAAVSVLVGPWWFGNEGHALLSTPDGRGQIHRSWLRNTFNMDSSPIPDSVLFSHALEPVGEMARCWFARELGRRDSVTQCGGPLFAWALETFNYSPPCTI